jgi:O-antigen/teichoic acid export membrane protein
VRQHLYRSGLNVIRGSAITAYNLAVPALLSRLFGLDSLSTVLLALQVAAFTLYFESGVANSISYFATTDPSTTSHLHRTGTRLMILIALVAAAVINFAAWPISERLGHQVGITLSFYQYLNIFLGCFLPLLVLNATLGVAQSKNQFASILAYSMVPRIGFLTVLGIGVLGNREHPLIYLACASLFMLLLVAAGIQNYGGNLRCARYKSECLQLDLDRKLLSSILHAGLWGIASFIIGYSTSIAFTIADNFNAGFNLTILAGSFLLLSFTAALFVPAMRQITEAIKVSDFQRIEKIYLIMVSVVLISGLMMYVIFYYEGKQLIHFWLGSKQVSDFNEGILITSVLYSITRSIGIPLTIIIIANNQYKNYGAGQIIEAFIAVSAVLLAIKGVNVKGIFGTLYIGAIANIIITMYISYVSPLKIGFENRSRIILLLTPQLLLVLIPLIKFYLINI